MKIQHDFHVHTRRSLCADQEVTVQDYLKVMRKNGITKVGFADHFWEGTPIEKVSDDKDVQRFYKVQNFVHVETIRDEIAVLSEAEKDGMTIRFGCECEYDPYKGDIAITEEYAEQFDFVIVPNSHTHMMMPSSLYQPYEKHKDFMLEAYRNVIESPLSRYVTAMAHPFEAVCCPYDNRILMDLITDDEYKRIFCATAEKEIAVEINTAGVRGMRLAELDRDPVIRMYRLAKECGCKFTFGSDSHRTDSYDSYVEKADHIAELLGLTEGDLHSIVK